MIFSRIKWNGRRSDNLDACSLAVFCFQMTPLALVWHVLVLMNPLALFSDFLTFSCFLDWVLPVGERPRGKRQLWDRENMKNAVIAVRSRTLGLKKASTIFNVPKTTLQRYVVNEEYSTEDLNVTKMGKRLAWDPQMMIRAVVSVKQKSLTVDQASKAFSVPKTTLQRYVAGKNTPQVLLGL